MDDTVACRPGTRWLPRSDTTGMVDAAVTAAVFRGLNIAADTSGIRVDDDWVGTAQVSSWASIGTGALPHRGQQPRPVST